jgi:antitoxin CptB
MSERNLSALRWGCRRGMRELDLLLTRYMDRDYGEAHPDQRAAFEQLLNLQDPEILALLTGRTIAENVSLRNVIEQLLVHP